MRALRYILLAMVLLVPAAGWADDDGGEEIYDLVEESSLLYVQVFKDESTLGSGLAHNHVIRASGWRGYVRIDPDDLSSCKISLVIPTGKLVVDEARMRRLVGYEGELDADDRSDIRESMLAEDQLAAAEHGEIRFLADRCAKLGGDRLKVHGKVMVRGVWKQVAFLAQLSLGEDSLQAKGSFTVKHADFGMEPYSGAMGLVKNAAAIKFVADVTGKLRKKK